MFQECDIAHLISIYTYIQGNKPLALLCIGDVIAILTRVFAILMLATLVIFFSLLMKLFLKQSDPHVISTYDVQRSRLISMNETIDVKLHIRQNTCNILGISHFLINLFHTPLYTIN